MFTWLPGLLIISQLCPDGAEATMFALLGGAMNLGQTLAHEFGVAPDGSAGEGEQFRNLWIVSAIASVLPLAPLAAAQYCIPDVSQREGLGDAEQRAAPAASAASSAAPAPPQRPASTHSAAVGGGAAPPPRRDDERRPRGAAGRCRAARRSTERRGAQLAAARARASRPIAAMRAAVDQQGGAAASNEWCGAEGNADDSDADYKQALVATEVRQLRPVALFIDGGGVLPPRTADTALRSPAVAPGAPTRGAAGGGSPRVIVAMAVLLAVHWATLYLAWRWDRGVDSRRRRRHAEAATTSAAPQKGAERRQAIPKQRRTPADGTGEGDSNRGEARARRKMRQRRLPVDRTGEEGTAMEELHTGAGRPPPPVEPSPFSPARRRWVDAARAVAAARRVGFRVGDSPVTLRVSLECGIVLAMEDGRPLLPVEPVRARPPPVERRVYSDGYVGTQEEY
eukprot:gene21543-32389_t